MQFAVRSAVNDKSVEAIAAADWKSAGTHLASRSQSNYNFNTDLKSNVNICVQDRG